MENHFYEKRRCLYFYCNLPKERGQDQTEKIKSLDTSDGGRGADRKNYVLKSEHVRKSGSQNEKSGSAHKMPNRSFPPLFAILIFNTWHLDP